MRFLMNLTIIHSGFMTRFKQVLIILVSIFIAVQISSCKNAAKKMVKEVGEEVADDAAKVGAKKIGKNVAGNFDVALKAMFKSHPGVEKAFNKMSKNMQKELSEDLATDIRLYKSFANTTLDDFTEFTAKSTKAADNINLLEMFSKSKRYDAADIMDFFVKDESGKMKFLRKSDNLPIAEYADGVIKLNDVLPTGKNPLLKSELIPNTLYKITREDGGQILSKTNELGRIISYEAKNINPKDITSELIGNVNYGPEFEKVIREAKRLAKGQPIDIKYTMRHSDDFMEPKYIKVDVSSKNKQLVSKTIENSNWGKFTRTELKNLRKINPEIDDYIKYLKKNSIPGSDFFKDENLILETATNGNIRLSVKNSASVMEIDGDIIKVVPGSTVNRGQMNEFMNYLLPNKTYSVADGTTVFKTNEKGEVFEVISDRNELLKLPKRSGTNKDIQKSVREGMQGVNGGHLIARNTNGPNELINQVPMLEEINQHGRWRELERIEEDALNAGKKVVSKRQILSRNPTTIKFISIIDGQTVTDEIVKVL